MAAVSGVLFKDDDLKELYDPGNGRPSLPPSLMSGVLLLQFHDDVSDEEAVQRLMFDLRWQVALNLPTDFPGFDPSSLTYFRQRLIEHNQERYAFDRFVAGGPGGRLHPGPGDLVDGHHAHQRCRGGHGHLHAAAQGHPQAAQAVGLCGGRQTAWAVARDAAPGGHLRRTGPQSQDRLDRPAAAGGPTASAVPGCRSRPGPGDRADGRRRCALHRLAAGQDHGRRHRARRPGPPADCRRHGAGSHHQHHRAGDAPWPQEQRPTLRRFQGCRDHRAVQRTDPGHPGHAGRRQRRPGTDAHHRSGSSSMPA